MGKMASLRKNLWPRLPSSAEALRQATRAGPGCGAVSQAHGPRVQLIMQHPLPVRKAQWFVSRETSLRSRVKTCACGALSREYHHFWRRRRGVYLASSTADDERRHRRRMSCLRMFCDAVFILRGNRSLLPTLRVAEISCSQPGTQIAPLRGKIRACRGSRSAAFLWQSLLLMLWLPALASIFHIREPCSGKRGRRPGT